MALAKDRPGFALTAVLHVRNYRLLCFGQALSLLGEQINLVALSWLALQISGNALALGSVLAASGLPPALLMLLSGAATDRFSPRTVLLAADALRLALVCAIVYLLLTANVTLPILVAVALGLGLLSALAMPAAGSIVPTLVPAEALRPANSLYLGLAQLAAFAGPACAGVMIIAGGTAGGEPAVPGTTGSTAFAPAFAPAFAAYALGLAVSVITLSLIRLPQPGSREGGPGAAPVLVNESGRHRTVGRISVRLSMSSFTSGWRYAWQDPLLRLILPAILATNLLITGPLNVGVPVLARLRLPEGAAAFGFMAAGWGGGNLLGALAAGTVRQTRGLGALFCLLFVTFGAGLAAFAWIASTWVGFLVLFVMGAGNGYLGVILRTLIHGRTPAQVLGRVMSVFFFARTLLVPLSQTISGAAIDASLHGLFIGAGVLFAVLAAWFTLSPAPRLFEQEVARARGDPRPV